jgi:hypothetical protein
VHRAHFGLLQLAGHPLDRQLKMVALIAIRRCQGITHLQRLRQRPAELELQRLAQIVTVQAVGKGPQIDQGAGIPQMQRTLAVGGTRGLLQIPRRQHQPPGAVLAELAQISLFLSTRKVSEG